MTDILIDLSPPSLAVAIKANLFSLFRSLGNSSQAIVRDSPPDFRWHTAVAHPWFNGVLSTQPPSEAVAESIRDTVAYFQTRHVASFSWWLAPDLDPVTWSPHLLAQGFQYDSSTPGMAIDLAALPLPAQQPLTIRRVEDRDTLAEWAYTFTRGYEIPDSMTPALLGLLDSLGTGLPYQHYLGSLEGKPVATSTLFVGAGVAGIYNVATRAEVRGQGIGSAITLAPLYAARDLGYRAGILHSSEIGFSAYQRLGFQKLCELDYFYRLV